MKIDIDLNVEKVLKIVEEHFDDKVLKISLADILTDTYVRTISDFNSVEEMFEQSPLVEEDLDAQDFLSEALDGGNEPLDEFVSANTEFTSFREMVKRGAENYIRRQV